MWDSTMLTAKCHRANRELEGKSSGIPHLAKNQRDMGHPSFVADVRESDGAFFRSLFSPCGFSSEPNTLLHWYFLEVSSWQGLKALIILDLWRHD
jgi:hypothetical protein